MQIISRFVVAIIDWLNAPGAVSDTAPTAADWADLPTYHPSQD